MKINNSAVCMQSRTIFTDRCNKWSIKSIYTYKDVYVSHMFTQQYSGEMHYSVSYDRLLKIRLCSTFNQKTARIDVENVKTKTGYENPSNKIALSFVVYLSLHFTQDVIQVAEKTKNYVSKKCNHIFYFIPSDT